MHIQCYEIIRAVEHPGLFRSEIQFHNAIRTSRKYNSRFYPGIFSSGVSFIMQIQF